MPKQHELMQFFKYEHLPEKLQAASKPFCVLATRLTTLPPDVLASAASQLITELLLTLEDEAPTNIETRVAIGKLKVAICDARWTDEVGVSNEFLVGNLLRLVLEAKDCAVRAVLYKEPEEA